jgi:hypothetical protein
MTLRTSLLASLALLTVAAACGRTDRPPVQPVPAPAVTAIEGTVTLLGQDGGPNPAGVRITLHRTKEEADYRVPAYTSALTRLPGPARVYSYRFEGVAPGNYYVVACFEFGCAAYHAPATGEYLRVQATASQTSVLHFGI